MTHHHAVVWLDHHEARVFAFNPDQTDRTVLHAHGQKGDNLRHNKGHLMGRKSPPDREFLHAIVDAVKDAPEILVVGPGSAKLELVKYVHEAAPRDPAQRHPRDISALRRSNLRGALGHPLLLG